MERNELRIAIEAYKRGFINDDEIENTEHDELLHECVIRLAIVLRDDIAKAIIKGFGGKDRLLHAFLALDRAYERSSLNWAMRDPESRGSRNRVSVAWLRKAAQMNGWMIDDFGSGPDLPPLVMVALWVDRDCPYLEWMRD